MSKPPLRHGVRAPARRARGQARRAAAPRPRRRTPSSPPRSTASRRRSSELRARHLLAPLAVGPRADLSAPGAPQDRSTTSRRSSTDVVELHGDRALRRRRGDASPASPRSTAAAWPFSATARAPTPRRTSAATSAARTPRASARRCASCDLAEKFGLPIVTLPRHRRAPTPASRPRSAVRRGRSPSRSRRSRTLRVPVVVRRHRRGRERRCARHRLRRPALMLENAYYSVISPEMCAPILYKDTEQAETAASCLQDDRRGPRGARHRRRGAARAARRRAPRPGRRVRGRGRRRSRARSTSWRDSRPG